MSETDFYDDYYEKYRSETHELTVTEKARIEKTIQFIPEDIKTVLEVGCGDGRIINNLIGKYECVCGLDISQKALEKVKTNKVQGSIENLPFPNNSFDLVICSEVIEHLPYNIYNKSLEELERVSKKNIIISVPNNENLKYRMIKCPQCGCIFHRYRHLRSFNEKQLGKLFNTFQIKKIHQIKSSRKVHPIFLTKASKSLRNLINRTLFFKDVVCPQCGFFEKKSVKNVQKKKEDNNPVSTFPEKIKNLPKISKGNGWLIALYDYSG